MAGRYTELFRHPSNQYTDYCPVVIIAGALQKDNETGKVIAQLKMQNIGEKPIESIKVTIRTYENNGNPTEGIEEFSYLDLNAGPGVLFGSRVAILLPDERTRSFSAEICEIVFSDKEVKNPIGSRWRTMPKGRVAKEVLTDEEMLKQFKIEVGNQSDYIPELKDGLFLCTCGAANLGTVEKCYKCQRSVTTLLSSADESFLLNESQKRQKEEKARVEAIAQKREENRKKLKKNTKIAAIALAAVLLLVGMGFGINKGINYLSLVKQYDKACDLLENGEYSQAIIEFEQLGSFKDAAEKIQECKYERACRYMEDGSYEKALAEFDSLAGYKDSRDKILTIKSIQLIASLDKKDYKRANSVMKSIQGSDSSDSESERQLGEARDKYYEAVVELINQKSYEDAIILLEGVDYKDCNELDINCKASAAMEFINNGDFDAASTYLNLLTEYLDEKGDDESTVNQAFQLYHDKAVQLINADKKYSEGKAMFEKVDYPDSKDYIAYCEVAEEVNSGLQNVNLTELYQKVLKLDGFNNAQALIKSNKYFSQMESYEGSWQAIDQFGYGNTSFDTKDVKVVVKDGSLAVREVSEDRQRDCYFMVKDGQLVLCDCDDPGTSYYSIVREGETLYMTGLRPGYKDVFIKAVKE